MALKSSETPFSFPQPEMDAKIDEVRKSNETVVRPVFDEFVRLEDQIRQMPIASRFSPTRIINSERVPGRLNPILDGKTEAEAKRLELLMKLGRLKTDLLSLVTDMEDLKMEVHVTGEEM